MKKVQVKKDNGDSIWSYTFYNISRITLLHEQMLCTFRIKYNFYSLERKENNIWKFSSQISFKHNSKVIVLNCIKFLRLYDTDESFSRMI